jgi:FkbH-like protein
MTEAETSKTSLRATRAAWLAHVRGRGDGEADLSVGISATFTADPLTPYLGGAALAAGYRRPEIALADYNQVHQTCLNPAQAFGGRSPEAIVLLWRIEDLAAGGDVAALADAGAGLIGMVRTLRDRHAGMIVLGLPPRPRPPEGRLVEFARLDGLERLWHRLCVEAGDLAAALGNVHVVDLEAVVSGIGAERAHDERKRLLYRQPYAEEVYEALAGRVLRLLSARRRAAKKCLVLDADNTMWGGIVGEDGVGGVAIGQDFPGSAFRDFQLQARELQRSGVFLAINSKNNLADVREVFDARAEMVLRWEDFSAVAVNWTPKSENLRTIARELNIGLDALVFIDDSHFEVAEVRAQTPEVTVLQAPADPAGLPALLRENAHLFDRLDITEDDRQRVGMMRQESERRQLSQTMSEAEFLATLGLVATIRTVTDADVARVTQLINKTNQFNVATRRYAVEEVEAMRRGGRHDLYCLFVADRFGDYGMVGVAIAERTDDEAFLDTLLMSCRVLGRGIETALISTVAAHQAERGARTIRGVYVPSAKNAMVADLFERHGFEREPGERAATGWRLDVSKRPAIQPFLRVDTQGLH